MYPYLAQYLQGLIVALCVPVENRISPIAVAVTVCESS